MRIAQIFVISLLLLTAYGCNASSDSVPGEKDTVSDTVTSDTTTVSLDKTDEMAKISYAMGANSGVFLARNLPEFEKWGMTINPELLKAGFLDTFENKSQMDEQEIQTVLLAFQETITAKLAEIDKEQAAVSSAANKLFLEENGAKEGVKTTASGIQYRILSAGEGNNPVATDTVKVNYKGTLVNGEEFDSSYKRGEPAQFPLDGVIPGWTEGLQLIKIELVLPSELAYGSRETASIPANSILIFEVELLEIVQPSTK